MKILNNLALGRKKKIYSLFWQFFDNYVSMTVIGSFELFGAVFSSLKTIIVKTNIFFLPIIFMPAWSDNKRYSSAYWKKHGNNDESCSWLFRNIYGYKIVADDGDGGESEDTDLCWLNFRPETLCLGFWIFREKVLKFD